MRRWGPNLALWGYRSSEEVGASASSSWGWGILRTRGPMIGSPSQSPGSASPEGNSILLFGPILPWHGREGEDVAPKAATTASLWQDTLALQGVASRNPSHREEGQRAWESLWPIRGLCLVKRPPWSEPWTLAVGTRGTVTLQESPVPEGRAEEVLSSRDQ